MEEAEGEGGRGRWVEGAEVWHAGFRETFTEELDCVGVLDTQGSGTGTEVINARRKDVFYW